MTLPVYSDVKSNAVQNAVEQNPPDSFIEISFLILLLSIALCRGTCLTTSLQVWAIWLQVGEKRYLIFNF